MRSFVITRGLLVPNQYFFVPNSAKFVPLYGLRAVPLFQKRNSWFVPNSIIIIMIIIIILLLLLLLLLLNNE